MLGQKNHVSTSIDRVVFDFRLRYAGHFLRMPTKVDRYSLYKFSPLHVLALNGVNMNW